jgi:hypothetical protein
MASITEIDTTKKKCADCGRVRGHKVDCPQLHADAEPTKPKRGTLVAAAAGGGTQHEPDLEGDDEDGIEDDDEDEDDEAIGAESGDDRDFPPITLIAGALDALQESFNAGDFSGDKQRQDDCEFEEPVDGDSMRCPNVAVIKKVLKNHCDACNRDRKETKLKLCLPHAINVWGGGSPHFLQTKMEFGS